MTRPRTLNQRSLLLIALLSLLCNACEKPETPPAEAGSDEASSTAPEATRADWEHSRCAPLEELAAMDPRQPVPLQPMMAWHQKQNMMEHLSAIQRIIGAAASEDWEGVAAASALIESSPRMQRMCQHMGAGAEGFTELALDFHERADEIGIAAQAEDKTAILEATSNTLKACTSCHSSYRQEVVNAATWQERTGSDHNPGMMHGSH
jgi:hypothetical protein